MGVDRMFREMEDRLLEPPPGETVIAVGEGVVHGLAERCGGT